MQERFDVQNAPVPPRRAGPRNPSRPSRSGHIEGVEATSGGLIRATLGSAVVAGVILTVFWLPAEYGIDATGLGRVLGLTQMGEIKQQLYSEAAAEDAALAASPNSPPAPLSGDPAQAERLAALEAQLAAIAARTDAAPMPPAEMPTAPQVETAAPAAEIAAAPAQADAPVPAWRDEVSYTLAPGEGIEVKLVMEEGAVAEFEWTANGAVLNFDTHGDGGGNNISYEKGRGVPDQVGTLKAAFTGNHGWFWRNRTEAPATMTLRARGDYSEMRAP